MGVTLVNTWFQHQHERIASKALRYEGTGTAGTCYMSAEAIGTFVPSPFDQTYGGMIFPTNSTNITLPIGSVVSTGGITVSGMDLRYLENMGAMLIINSGGFVNRHYYLGYIMQVIYDGVNSLLVPFTPVGETPPYIVAGANVFLRWYIFLDPPPPLPATAAAPSPNLLITDPTMVSLEYTSATQWGSNAPRVISPVKVSRRSSPWAGSPSFVSGLTNFELPCKLDPGYYCLHTQSGNWADIVPGTNKAEADTAPFVITLERPKYICDLAKNITQRDDSNPSPPGIWDHRQGMFKSRLYLNGIADKEIYGKAQTRDGNWIITETANLDGVIFPQQWSADHFGSRHVSGYPYEAVANASLQFNGSHHIAEQQIVRHWRATGGIVAHSNDTGNRGANYAWGVAWDIFFAGSVEVKAGDLVAFGNGGSLTHGIFHVDNSEPYYGSPGGAPVGFYTLISIYPQPNMSIINDMECFVLLKTSLRGRWLKYSADWSTFTVVRDCVVDTAVEPEGQVQLKLDSRTPPGKSFTVELDEASGIYRCDLGELDISTLDFVRTANWTQLRIEDADPQGVPPVYPQPDNPGLVYNASGCGTNQLNQWIICHPSLAGQTLWIAFKYYDDGVYIQDLWTQPSSILWAVERGTGKIYRYIETTGIEFYQDMARGQTGALASFVGDVGMTWAVSEPSGYLCTFQQQHSGHIDKLALDLKVADALGAVAKACDARVYLNGKSILRVISNQGPSQSPTAYDKFTVRTPTPVVSSGIETENIRIAYDGGVAQATKDIRYRQIDLRCVQTYPHANKICTDYYNRNNRGLVEVNIPLIDFSNELGESIAVPKPDVPWKLGAQEILGRIISYDKDTSRQIAAVKARRE